VEELRMMQLAVGIEMIFTELDFLSRIDAVASTGLVAFEIWDWKDKNITAIDESKKKNNCKLVALSLDPPVDVLEGGAIPDLKKAVHESCSTARNLDCPFVVCHLQEVPWGSGPVWYSFLFDEDKKLKRAKQKANYIEALKAAAPIAKEYGTTLLLEPVNTIVDHSGYFLSSSAEAAEIIQEVNSPYLGLLFDCYHMQITEGNLIANLTKHRDIIRHIHVADVPGRHEPGTGEINYENLLAAVKDLGYQGYIGLEYDPLSDSKGSLKNITQIIQSINK
jgi:hydroxypyruvate isomerase